MFVYKLICYTYALSKNFFPVLFTIEVDHRNNAPSPIIVRYSSLWSHSFREFQLRTQATKPIT